MSVLVIHILIDLIDEEWLKKNKKFDEEGRIIANGKLWGDDEDPEILKAQQKDLCAEKSTKKEQKRAREAEFDEQKAAKKEAKKHKKRKVTKKTGTREGGNQAGGTRVQKQELIGQAAAGYAGAQFAFPPQFVEGSSKDNAAGSVGPFLTIDPTGSGSELD